MLNRLKLDENQWYYEIDTPEGKEDATDQENILIRNTPFEYHSTTIS